MCAGVQVVCFKGSTAAVMDEAQVSHRFHQEMHPPPLYTSSFSRPCGGGSSPRTCIAPAVPMGGTLSLTVPSSCTGLCTAPTSCSTPPSRSPSRCAPLPLLCFAASVKCLHSCCCNRPPACYTPRCINPRMAGIPGCGKTCLAGSCIGKHTCRRQHATVQHTASGSAFHCVPLIHPAREAGGAEMLAHLSARMLVVMLHAPKRAVPLLLGQVQRGWFPGWDGHPSLPSRNSLPSFRLPSPCSFATASAAGS